MYTYIRVHDPVVCRFSLLRRFTTLPFEIFIFSEHDLELHKPGFVFKRELSRLCALMYAYVFRGYVVYNAHGFNDTTDDESGGLITVS